MTRRPYVAHPRHPVTGRQFRVSGATPRQLSARLALVNQYREELRLGARSSLDVSRQLRRLTRGPVTLERATESYVTRGDLADVTRSRVRSWIEGPARELRARELDDLDAPTVAAWVARVARSSAPSTTGLAWRTLRAVVRYAAERGLVNRCPWGVWRPSSRVAGGLGARPGLEQREACRTAEERERLVAAARCYGLELACKVAVASFAGLRSSELARLSWVHVVRGALLVHGSKRTPLARLEVPELVGELLVDWGREVEAAGLYASRGPVFPCRRTSRPGLPRFARRVLTCAELRAAVRRAELPHPERWSPHSLRDSFATIEHAALGGDLAALMERTRHASVASLLRYLRPRQRDPLPALPA